MYVVAVNGEDALMSADRNLAVYFVFLFLSAKISLGLAFGQTRCQLTL